MDERKEDIVRNTEPQPENDEPIKMVNNAATELAGGIAALVFEKRLSEGDSIEIPSLGLKIVRSNPEDPDTTHIEPL